MSSDIACTAVSICCRSMAWQEAQNTRSPAATRSPGPSRFPHSAQRSSDVVGVEGAEASSAAIGPSVLQLVTSGGHDYLVAVLSDGHATQAKGVALVEAAAKAAMSAFTDA